MFQAFSIPEIKRVSLGSIVLQMMVMGLSDIKRFPFIDDIQEKSLSSAIELLKVTFFFVFFRFKLFIFKII